MLGGNGREASLFLSSSDQEYDDDIALSQGFDIIVQYFQNMKIISGGQTGVDWAAIDIVIELGLEYGGSIHLGRKAEDGPIDPKYDKLTELASPDYRARTQQNVLDPDATLIFTIGAPTGGTAATIEFARKYNKPHLIIDLKTTDSESTVALINDWLRRTRPAILNIAGPRESKCPGIYTITRDILEKVLDRRS